MKINRRPTSGSVPSHLLAQGLRQSKLTREAGRDKIRYRSVQRVSEAVGFSLIVILAVLIVILTMAIGGYMVLAT